MTLFSFDLRSMASVRASSLIMQSSLTSSCGGSHKLTRIRVPIHVPKASNIRMIMAPTRSVDNNSFVEDHKTSILESFSQMTKPLSPSSSKPLVANNTDLVMAEVYMILEAVSDRVEMHTNVSEQRNNWNTLLLSSINMMTLTATTLSGLATSSGATHLGVNMSSFVMFTAATGLLVIMNKIQPSQLAEEQRNATRLFKRLEREIKTLIAIGKPTHKDVISLMEKVLALDRAYPLPLLGAMIDKFPSEFKPAQWWPSDNKTIVNIETKDHNGWSTTLEREMMNIVRLVKAKDDEEYKRLGNIALKLNKVLAVAGPALTSIAALASAFASNSSIGSSAALVAMVSGAFACAVNSFEHGGQVGMVAEMYRNCGGAFKRMEESIESNIESKRENGEVFEMKVALQLGRSLSELREVAKKYSRCESDGITIDEFASKLF